MWPIMHLRPWPWILIALASLVVFPELSDIQKAFPNLPADKLGHDVAYPAMLTLIALRVARTCSRLTYCRIYEYHVHATESWVPVIW